MYEALDEESNTRVALKTLAVPKPDQLVRLKSEFRAIRDLRHPNLVELGELSEDDGQWFFTMELVDGVDFLTWVRGEHHQQVDTSSQRTAVARGPSSDPHAPSPVHDDPSGPTAPDTMGRRPLFDEGRLRAGLGSLTETLSFLHAAGKVHRDIKPTNLLVTASGRLVLIDFGVALELADQDLDSGLVIGTSMYMAPEQARAETLGPAADWYAVGVLLFEALTGRPPFRGSPEQVLELKCSVDAPPPSLLVDGVARDLDRLCTRLLARDAAARPDGAEVAAALGLRHEPCPGTPARSRPPFVGRTAELDVLERNYAQVRAGAARPVLLEGPSGVGKSELADRFVERLRAREPKLLVLSGRCHEQERVPYNALDAVVDGLARFVASRPMEKLTPLLPAQLAPLARLFPVLQAVEPIAQAAIGQPEAPAPGERGAGFQALRELLAKVARSRPTVVVVHDLQWADADSQRLLAELMRGSEAPPLLFLATARLGADGASCVPAAALGSRLTTVRLEGLDREDAEALVTALLDNLGAPAPVDVSGVLDEAAGHPLFLDELVRHVLRRPRDARVVPLADAICARAESFPPPARALLNAVAAAGAPISHAAAAVAAGLSPPEYREQVAALRAAQLLRISGTRSADTVEAYHDRVRESLYERLPAADRATQHARLAAALEADGAGPDVLCHHFEQAGEPARAAPFAERAAAAAAAALAFDRAAELYRRAVALDVHDDAGRLSLLTRLGDALAHAGRSQEAAETFTRAATGAGVSADEGLELRRRAAEQLLMGGHLGPGLSATRALLAELDLTLPEAGVGALARVGWQKTRLALRPLRWTVRPAPDLDARTRSLLDTYYSVGAGLSLVDSVRGMLFVLGGALLALEGGDEARIARALCMAAIAEAGLGSRRRAHRLADGAERAARSEGSDRARFYGEMARHGCTFLLDNDWRAVLGGIEQALALWRASGRTVGWEWDAAEQFACWSLDNMGRLREVSERATSRIRAAQQAGNRFMEVNFRCFFVHAHLMPDRPGEARRDVEEAIASWLPGSDDFGNQHFLAQRSLTYVALYQGDVLAVGPSLDAGWRRFDRSMMRHVPFLRQDGLMLSSSLALARAVEARHRRDERTAASELLRARRGAERMERIDLPMAQTSLPRLRAGLAAYAGDDAEAARQLRLALARTEAGGSALHTAAIQLRLGVLLGGDEGAALTAAGQAWMAGERVCNPERLTAAITPGWRHPG